MKITENLLRRKHACANQLALFIETFPHGVEVTETVCVSVADKFNWDWAAINFLPTSLWTDYATKRTALYADVAKKLTPLFADYETKCAPLYANYEAKRAALYADYEAKCAALYADYDAKRAALFGRLAETI